VTTQIRGQLSTTWPTLAPPAAGPRTAVSAYVAERLFRAGVSRLDVTVHIVGSKGVETIGMGGPVLTIRRPAEFFARLGRGVLIGFGEAYLTGAWEADDLAQVLSVMAAELPTLVPESLQRLRALAVKRPPRAEKSTASNARGNIAHHYDLSNELFATFLDESLSYSAALYTSTHAPSVDLAGDLLRATPPDPTDSLVDAQHRKIDRLLDQAGVTDGSRVLEIGTGWGELAIRAARRGATVHTITLSSEQLALAEQRIAAAGMSDRVTVQLLDYRALPSRPTYDAVVSVEMIEAVGFDFWQTYFETLDRVLAPGGKVALQAITMPHDRMLATRSTYTWINKYIFPGGFLPSVEAIQRLTTDHTLLRLTDRLAFGSHYAETLRRWDATFVEHSDRVLSLGFDNTFLRMWHFYLAYTRVGFASGYIDVQQLTFARPDES
jgi:cyclopropane-fatty-acyl-phospholipid synthase